MSRSGALPLLGPPSPRSARLIGLAPPQLQDRQTGRDHATTTAPEPGEAAVAAAVEPVAFDASWSSEMGTIRCRSPSSEHRRDRRRRAGVGLVRAGRGTTPPTSPATPRAGDEDQRTADRQAVPKVDELHHRTVDVDEDLPDPIDAEDVHEHDDGGEAPTPAASPPTAPDATASLVARRPRSSGDDPRAGHDDTERRRARRHERAARRSPASPKKCELGEPLDQPDQGQEDRDDAAVTAPREAAGRVSIRPSPPRRCPAARPAGRSGPGRGRGTRTRHASENALGMPNPVRNSGGPTDCRSAEHEPAQRRAGDARRCRPGRRP